MVMAAGAEEANALAAATAIQCVRLFFPSGYILFPIWGQHAVLTLLIAMIQSIVWRFSVPPTPDVCMLAHKRTIAAVVELLG